MTESTRYLKPDGASAMRLHILSCGSIDCQETARALEHVRVVIPLSAIGKRANGGWWTAFRRLDDYCSERGITHIGAYEVVAYFGSGFHADIMLRGGYIRLGQYLGEDLGLMTHLSLPISEDGVYENGGYTLKFEDWLDLGGKGQLFCHLGIGFRLPLTNKQVSTILKDQRESKPFMAALSRANGQSVKIPNEYWEAMNCTVKEAARK